MQLWTGLGLEAEAGLFPSQFQDGGRVSLPGFADELVADLLDAIAGAADAERPGRAKNQDQAPFCFTIYNLPFTIELT